MILTIAEFFKYLLLGLVQGITEPLPISSSGHLIIFKNIVGVSMHDEINFNIIVNFASLIAILFFYRQFLSQLFGGAFLYVFKRAKDRKQDFLYCMLIVLATIPAGIAGLFLKDIIDEKFSSLLSVAIALFITGLLLQFIHYRSKKTTTDVISVKASIWMGLAQIVGLFPGISRSGSTTSLGVLSGVNLEKALRFSFMMYIPVSVASLILGIADLEVTKIYVAGYVGAFVASLIGTYIAIHLFFRLVKKDNLKYFGYYCLTISMLVLLYLVIQK